MYGKSNSSVSTLPNFTAVIPLKNENLHNYPLNKMVILFQSGVEYTVMGVKEDGSFGNSLQLMPSHYRKATEVEIKNISEAQLKTLMKYIVVL